MAKVFVHCRDPKSSEYDRNIEIFFRSIPSKGDFFITRGPDGTDEWWEVILCVAYAFDDPLDAEIYAVTADRTRIQAEIILA